MVSEEKLYYPGIQPILEASGVTGIILHGTSENFTLDNWAYPLQIENIKVVSSAGANPFTFSIFELLARTANSLVYRVTGAAVRIDDNLLRPLPFHAAVTNSTGTRGSKISTQTPFYCTIANNDAALDGTFYVQIRYHVQGGPVDNDVVATTPNLLAPLTDNV